jgi:high-affinity iron transporter
LTFREVLEAALLSAIILAFLVKTGRVHLARYAWFGIYGAIAASFGLGGAIWILYGILSKANQVLFEGVAALIAVGVLTSMIYWMAVKGRTLKAKVEGRVEAAISRGAILGLASLTFVLVFREGLETVLFLTPFLVQDTGQTLLGASLGLVAGTALAYAIFRMGLKLDLRKFFYFTSILLILLAGGLFGYGIHELIEYGKLQGTDFGWWGQAAYVLPIASDSLLGHKGAIGSVLSVMFGYSVNPEWARVIGHASYLGVTLPLVIIIYTRPGVLALIAARARAFMAPTPRSSPGAQED